MGKSPRDNIEKQRDDIRTYLGYKKNTTGITDVYTDSRGMTRHMAVFGQTGYGKSTLHRNILLQTARHGHGLCYIDPNGDDSYELIQQLPEDRLYDVIWIEPRSERDGDVSIDIFDTVHTSDHHKYEMGVENIAGDIKNLIEKVSDDEINHRASELVSEIAKNLIRSNREYLFEDLSEILEIIVYDHYYSSLPDSVE